MRIHRETKTPGDIINISLLDDENNMMLEFENRSHSFGIKIAVCDSQGYLVYLIDDTSSGDYDELTIMDDSREVVKLKIADNFFASYHVSITAADGEYDFLLFRRTLKKNGAAIAEIKPHLAKLGMAADSDNDAKTKTTLGIIGLLRDGAVSILDHIDFDIHTDDPQSLKLYMVILYSMQYLVINRITSLID